MIYVNNLHKSFGKNEVLKGIDEHITKGEVVVVIGPSGSGKSTFLRCLNLLETPTDGQITFEGKDITSKETNIDRMREKMGMVFQQFNLFPHKTVYENPLPYESGYGDVPEGFRRAGWRLYGLVL